MKREEIMGRMGFVLHGDYLRRVRIYCNEEEETIISVDLHGMCKESAQRSLKNIIAIIRSPFILDVIHGYNGGTVIKELICNELHSPKIKGHSSPNWNPGETFLHIA
jgi:DNA-nicking Smr family endonuclease